MLAWRPLLPNSRVGAQLTFGKMSSFNLVCKAQRNVMLAGARSPCNQPLHPSNAATATRYSMDGISTSLLHLRTVRSLATETGSTQHANKPTSSARPVPSTSSTFSSGNKSPSPGANEPQEPSSKPQTQANDQRQKKHQGEQQFTSELEYTKSIMATCTRISQDEQRDPALVGRVAEMFEEMKRSGYTPHKLIYKNILRAYAYSGDVYGAERFFKTIVADNMLSLPIYNTMIKIYARGEQYDNALNLIKQMKANKIAPTEVTYENIIDEIESVYFQRLHLYYQEVDPKEAQSDAQYISKVNLRNRMIDEIRNLKEETFLKENPPTKPEMTFYYNPFDPATLIKNTSN